MENNNQNQTQEKEQSATEEFEKRLDPFRDDFKLFIEAGFMAIYQQDENSAMKLFTAAQLLRPDDLTPQLGYGYIELYALQLDNVEQRMTWLLERDKENYIAKTLLGLAYLLKREEKKEQGFYLLEEAAAKSNDPVVHKMVEFMKQWLEKQAAEKEKTQSPIDMMSNTGE